MKKFLKYFKRLPSKVPKNECRLLFVTDFEFCRSLGELRDMLRRIDMNGYALVSVTQDKDVYTVFFRRAENG